MRLPRRVPWATLAELEQVCTWIYADEHDYDARQRATSRLAAWKAAVPLPHALESVHALLSVTLQDSSGPASSSYLSLRMSYASAIIRLVNGLVDPLQLGAYARPIHSIAQQLGLPAWFVELRHAATHEDLPSLEVLREAARQAMNWLRDNYFIPTLNPAAPPAAPTVPLRPLLPTLKQYKSLMKATTRDATLRVQYRNEINKVTRDVERWIAEARVSAAGINAGTGGWEEPSDDTDEDDEDPRERWALDQLSEVLLEKGMLVPLSKKKRLPAGHASLTLPHSSIVIWSPLLTHLQSLHPTLSLRLVIAITTHLSRTPSSTPGAETELGADTVLFSTATTEETKTDSTYDLCLASWAKWLTGSDSGSVGVEDVEKSLVKIVSTLGPYRIEGSRSKAADALLQALSAERPKLATTLSILTQAPAQDSTPKAWDDTAIGIMDARLNALLSLQAAEGEGEHGPSPSSAPSGTPDTSKDVQPPPGWRKLTSRDGWRPAPIGLYVSCP